MHPKFSYWSVPRMWPGDKAVVVGGGASLTAEQLAMCRGRARVVVINDAYLLAPWADLHYFCDHKWWIWHKKGEHPAQKLFGKPRATSHFWGFQGLRVCLESAVKAVDDDPSIKVLRNDSRPEHHPDNLAHKDGICLKPDGVRSGGNSTYQVINLLYHTGVADILLIGVDYHGQHWFGDHPILSNPDYKQVLAPRFGSLLKPLQGAGINVTNCSPGSHLTIFPRGDLADCL